MGLDINVSELIKLNTEEFRELYSRKSSVLRLMGENSDIWLNIVNDIGEGYELLGDSCVIPMAWNLYIKNCNDNGIYTNEQHLIPCTYSLKGVKLRKVLLDCGSFSLYDRYLFVTNRLLSEVSSVIENIVVNDSCILDLASCNDLKSIVINKTTNDDNIVMVSIEYTEGESDPSMIDNGISVNSDMIAITDEHLMIGNFNVQYGVIESDEGLINKIYEYLGENDSYAARRVRFGADWLGLGKESVKGNTPENVAKMSRLPLELKKELVECCNRRMIEKGYKIRQI